MVGESDHGDALRVARRSKPTLAISMRILQLKLVPLLFPMNKSDTQLHKAGLGRR